MTRPADSKAGAEAGAETPRTPRRGHGGDHLKNKSAAESEFQTQFTPGAVRGVPVKLGSKEYDRDMWDSPMMRTLKRAITGWEVPAAGSGLTLGKVLKEGDPRLTETQALPGREGWRQALQAQLVSLGAVQRKPTAYVLAGPMGVGKLALSRRLYAEGVFPNEVVKADADHLHALVPEQSVLLALGDGRAASVVHEEASAIGQAAYFQALAEKRDVVHNTMLGGAAQLDRLTKAKAAGFKRIVVALISSLEVAKARAGADGASYPEAALADSHRDFAKAFDAVVKQSDQLVLLNNTGARFEIVAQARASELSVKDEKAWAAFQALKNLP